MSRSELKIIEGGFPIYGDKQLRKVNAMRRAFSAPDSIDPVVNTKGEALFVTGEEMNDEPSSCYNCQFYNETHKTCGLIGPRKIVAKFIWPKEATTDSKQIEYWPDCGMHLYGKTNKGPAVYYSHCDPDYIGLIWINAPKLGLPHGGSNCGGANGGDDCDHYTVEGNKPKWESPTGFCRALQTTVACNDDCAQWRDDDTLQWQDAQRLLADLGYYKDFKPELAKETEKGLDRWAILFVGGKDTNREPKSCFNCPHLFEKQRTCEYIGTSVKIETLKKDGQIYTPVCGYQIGGKPTITDNPKYLGGKDPEELGLEWAKGKGTNCYGWAGGAPCEHFDHTEGEDGTCDLMKKSDNKVDSDDCCAAHLGESIPWKEAQSILKGQHAAS